MTLDNIKKLFKFSWSQAWSDQNGKSSGTAWTGWFLCVISGIGFLYALFLKQTDGMMYSLGFATLGAGLLGYNKKVNGKPESLGVTDDGIVTDAPKIDGDPMENEQTTQPPN